MGSGLAVPQPWPNNPVERTAHSVGSVLIRGSVPVGRRSPGAFGARGTEAKPTATNCLRRLAL
jgi:hypothetical protein